MSRTVSPGPSRVHSRADASSSNSNGIPSSTVVGIGGGFVAFAVTVLSVFTLSRVVRLALRARRERESGVDVTFRELWNREGGFWGFMTGLGGESAAIGAGAHILDSAQQRRWEQLVMRSGMMRLEEDDLRQKPEMWEFRVPEKSGIGEDAVHLKACRVSVEVRRRLLKISAVGGDELQPSRKHDSIRSDSRFVTPHLITDIATTS